MPAFDSNASTHNIKTERVLEKLATSYMESVAAFVWNRWQLCRGISGRIRLESVAALAWNTQISLPYTFFLLNGDMELNRDWQLFVLTGCEFC